jgi:hypothetical protein
MRAVEHHRQLLSRDESDRRGKPLTAVRHSVLDRRTSHPGADATFSPRKRNTTGIISRLDQADVITSQGVIIENVGARSRVSLGCAWEMLWR